MTDQTSTPIPGAGHDYIHMLTETVNPANGSVSLRIQVPVPKGRGLTLPFAFAYDSNGVNVLYSSVGQGEWRSNTTFLSQGGWSYAVPLLSANEIFLMEGPQRQYSCPLLIDYVFQDPSGGRHALGLASVDYIQGECSGDPTHQAGGDDLFRASMIGCGTTGLCYPVAIADADGTVYTFNSPNAHGVSGGFGASLPYEVEDRNGNVVTVTDNNHEAFTFTDTAGRTAISSSGFGKSGNTLTASGLGGPYTIDWGTASSNFSVEATNAGPNTYCRGISGTALTNPVVTSIELPNGQKYSFYYDSTYGLLREIVLPTGGYVQYTWELNGEAELASFPDTEGANNGCVYKYGWPAVASRMVSFDGSTVAETQTFSYSTTWNGTTWTAKKTTVTTDDNLRGTSFETSYTYSSVGGPNPPYDEQYFGDQLPVEQSVVYQDWNGATLRTENKSWFDQFEMTCASTTQGSLTAQIDYAYSQYGAQVTDEKQWDWGQAPACGSSSSGTPARETQTAYQSFGDTHAYPYGPSIFDRPEGVTIFGNGTQAAQTTYAYDGSGVQSAGVIVGRDSTYNGNSTIPRGNATSKIDWLSGGTSPATAYAYDDTGQMLAMKDPNGNTTSYSYADSYASGSPPSQTNAYLTQITYPNTGVAHVEKFSYNYADGQLAVSTDQNQNPTTYVYNDSLDRLTAIHYPDRGETIYSYNDSLVSATTPSITVQRLVSTGYDTNVSIMDGAGHVVRQELTSDPQGTDYTDTAYDGEGLVWKQSNPYRSTSEPSYGLSTTVYDALGRVTSITRPDGNAATTSYSSNCSTAIGEAGKARETCSDGLGRMTEVFEDPSGLNYETTYSYDALDSLLSVTEGSQTRTFVYDSLSRLTSAANPESGTVTYTYDANGNVLTRKDARGITTTYAYDALNRVTSKSYSDGTPVANFWYDYNSATFGNWTQGSLTNTIGRLYATDTSTSPGNYQSPDTGTVYSYDSMGRVLNYWQCTPYNCGSSTWGMQYSYDLAGDVQSWTHPAGFTITNTINAAQQITQTAQTQSSWVDSTHPQYLAKEITYTPWGAEQTLENGCTSSSGQEQGCTDTLETYAYNNRLQPVMIELGTSSNASADYCLIYNYYTSVGNPGSCAVPSEGTGNNGTVIGSFYQDNVNSSLSHTEAYAYDSVNRLTSAAATGSWTYNLTFSYDRLGNMQCVQNGNTNGPCAQWGINTTTNQLSGTGFSYDAAGHLTSDGVNGYTYQWDAEGHMTQLTQGSSTLESNSYNAFGLRAQMNDPTWTALQYLYDPEGRHIGNFSGNTNSWFTMSSLGRNLFEYYEGSDTYLYHHNALGSTSMMTAHDGSVINDSLLLPWGRLAAGTGETLYAAFRDSDADLWPTQFRFYNPAIGRWLTPDPNNAGADPSNPQSWNAYAYALNNPTTNVDPLGLQSRQTLEGTCTMENFGASGCPGGPAVGWDPFGLLGIPVVTDTFEPPQLLSTIDFAALSNANGAATSVSLFSPGGFTTTYLGDAFTLLGSQSAQPSGGGCGLDLACHFFTGFVGAFVNNQPSGLLHLAGAVAGGVVLGALGEAGEEAEGAASDYIDVTRSSALEPNRLTNVMPQEFGESLQAQGFKKSVQGELTVYTKGGTEYDVYPQAGSTGGPTAQMKVAGRVVLKIRLQP